MGNSSEKARIAIAIINKKLRCSYLNGYRIAEGKSRASCKDMEMHCHDQKKIKYFLQDLCALVSIIALIAVAYVWQSEIADMIIAWRVML